MAKFADAIIIVRLCVYERTKLRTLQVLRLRHVVSQRLKRLCTAASATHHSSSIFVPF